ncbi:MAG TPA: polysaccharide deacetylase family protein [bacterium]|nr:polysaccharide deacetylase family protein [bacterium]
MKIAAFNIDADPAVCYYSIHGLSQPVITDDPVYSSGLRRFLDLLDSEGIKGTFFITAFGFNEKNIPVLKEIVDRGHEIGNHSFSHDYRLTLMPTGEIEKDIAENHKFIEQVSGYRCTGFRSPGYNSSPGIISVLKKAGYSYDSSFFPSPLYYAAKWLLMKLKAFRGHRSMSMIYSFMDSIGGYKPVFIDKNVRDIVKEGNFAEIPITTLFPPLGVPLIGTSLIAFPSFVLKIMMKVSLMRSFINIETHGIDLCDRAESDIFAPLADVQPDLKYDLEHKLDRFRETIRFYKDNGYEFKTLSQIASMKKEGHEF